MMITRNFIISSLAVVAVAVAAVSDAESRARFKTAAHRSLLGWVIDSASGQHSMPPASGIPRFTVRTICNPRRPVR